MSVCEVLQAVKKMEDTLRRLKRLPTSRRAEKADAASGGGALSDDDKIRLQLLLDLQAFASALDSLGGGGGGGDESGGAEQRRSSALRTRQFDVAAAAGAAAVAPSSGAGEAPPGGGALSLDALIQSLESALAAAAALPPK